MNMVPEGSVNPEAVELGYRVYSCSLTHEPEDLWSTRNRVSDHFKKTPPCWQKQKSIFR